MANRYSYQFRLSMVPKVTDIFAHVTFGASGAPTLDAVNSKGVVSITRNSAGLYTIVFGTSALRLDPYSYLCMVKQVFINATAPAAPGMYIVADNSANPALASIQVQFNAAGVATDPASGEQVKMEMTFRNSSVS
jgi:hypothetical protein